MTFSGPQSQTSQTSLAPLTAESKEDRERDRQMRSLVTALRKHKDELPQDVQTVMKEISVKTGQDETKILHAAVSQHGRARKELEAAQAARLQLHSSWRNFLSKSVEQWKTFTTQFMEQEKAVSERVTTARESLMTAKEHLASCKSAAGADSREDAMSDGEETAKDSDNVAGDKIAESFKGLSTTLEGLQSQAAQAVQQEEEDQQDQLKKRQRITPPEVNSADKPDAPSSHFGGAE